jgi:site-specific DNA recombinase
MSRPKTNGKQRAVLYARFSPRPNATECESVEAQLSDCRDYCAKHAYTIVGEFRDEGQSGDDADRPGLESALAALKRGCVLVTTSSDRLARGALNSALVMKIAAMGATWETVDGVDTKDETPETVLVREILAAVSGFQLRHGRRTTSSRMKTYQKSGRPMSNRTPYGWKRVEDSARKEYRDPAGNLVRLGLPVQMVPDDAEQAVIERIIKLRDDGHTLRGICDALGAGGATCRGGPFYNGTVRSILRRAGAMSMPTNGQGE